MINRTLGNRWGFQEAIYQLHDKGKKKRKKRKGTIKYEMKISFFYFRNFIQKLCKYLIIIKLKYIIKL